MAWLIILIICKIQKNKSTFLVQHIALRDSIHKLLQNSASLVEVRAVVDAVCNLVSLNNHKQKVFCLCTLVSQLILF